MARPCVVVLVTTPSPAISRRIARALVGERLAACVNILPGITSVYRWKGKVERGREELLLVKTTRARLKAVERRVKALHPYDVPEIAALPLDGGSADYRAWIEASVGR